MCEMPGDRRRVRKCPTPLTDNVSKCPVLSTTLIGRCLDNHAEVDTVAVDTTGPVVPVAQTDVEVQGVEEFHCPVPNNEMPLAHSASY